MAQIAEPDAPRGRSRSLELNLVPMIDVMSCLTAFLLVTAAWIQTAQLAVEPAGKARDGERCRDDECPLELAVLVEDDAIWVEVPRLLERERIARGADGRHDYARLEQRLRARKESVLFQGTSAIEVAAASSDRAPVRYQDLIAAMDTAVRAGFPDIGLGAAAGLTAPPAP
jgi:biopolymer transport protein ExbD